MVGPDAVEQDVDEGLLRRVPDLLERLGRHEDPVANFNAA
jgi:hypothetical protein